MSLVKKTTLAKRHFNARNASLTLSKLSNVRDSSTDFQAPPQAAYCFWSCNKVYHKQEVCFLLYFLGQIVSWQYNPNLLDYHWPCTVINDYDWQLWNCPLDAVFGDLLCKSYCTDFNYLENNTWVDGGGCWLLPLQRDKMPAAHGHPFIVLYNHMST